MFKTTISGLGVVLCLALTLTACGAQEDDEIGAEMLSSNGSNSNGSSNDGTTGPGNMNIEEGTFEEEVQPHVFGIMVTNNTDTTIFLEVYRNFGAPFGLMKDGAKLLLVDDNCDCSEVCGSGQGCGISDGVPTVAELSPGQTASVKHEVYLYETINADDTLAGQCPETQTCNMTSEFEAGEYTLDLVWDTQSAIEDQGMALDPEAVTDWGLPQWWGGCFGCSAVLEQTITQTFSLSGDNSSIELSIE